MPIRNKIETFAVIGAAAVFQWFFMFTKHDPRLRPVIPFGEDPYDALGSFATIVNILLLVILVWRTFRPYRGAPSARSVLLLRRTQAAMLLCILVSLAVDAVAMARHPGQWMVAGAEDILLSSFVAVTMLAATALYVVKRSDALPSASRVEATYPVAVAGVFLVTLALYPERWTQGLATHVLTIFIGDLALFVPVAALLVFLFPEPVSAEGEQLRSRRPSALLWIAVVVIGFVMGGWLFAIEMGEGDGSPAPPHQRMVVAVVIVGLTVMGMVVAHACLSGPLGLSGRKRQPEG